MNDVIVLLFLFGFLFLFDLFLVFNAWHTFSY